MKSDNSRTLTANHPKLGKQNASIAHPAKRRSMDIAVYGASASNVFHTDTDSNQKPQYAEVAQSVEQQYKNVGYPVPLTAKL